jgi:PBSX family phage terminase large subunit
MRIAAPFRANAKQQQCADQWFDRGCRRLLASGAIRSGKTQAAGRLFVETAVEQPSQYLVARLTYRELEDSTKKAMLHGDGSIPPLIPPQLIDQYRASDNLVRLKTGSTILFRSLDEPAKLLNLTLGGAFIDQIEELDPGDEGERIFDTLIGRLSDSSGPRKLIAVANPASTMHWVYRRFVNEATRDEGARHVPFTLRDNAANLPADYVAAMEATRLTRPFWFRSFVLGEWGAFEGAAFTEFDPAVHVVEPFEVGTGWERFEAMDHGQNNPTAWLLWVVDYDGNLIVADEYYSPGLVSRHAPEIRRRRQAWWDANGESNTCWADPSIFARHGHADRLGRPASIATEYSDFGIGLAAANHDRKAGYLRLAELLHIDPQRTPPPFARIPASVQGAPRLYVFSTCKHLIEQFKSAPVAKDGVDAGEAVDPKWESAHGHAIAAARYGAMSRPSPSEQPEREPEIEDPRQRALVALIRREEENERFEDEIARDWWA